ncbi:unnamed protein product [Lota lota]
MLDEGCSSPPPLKQSTIMSPQEAALGKKSHWSQLEITGGVRHLSSSLWRLSHLTALYINNNHLTSLPPDIACLHRLEYLNLSCNQLCTLPSEIGTVVSLRELHLNENKLSILPFELGKLFQLHTLGIEGNPLSEDIYILHQEPEGTRKVLNYLLDSLPVGPLQPFLRPWVTVKSRNQLISTATLTVMCYNVLCDKYATQQMYGYCPSWALSWEYRKKGIVEEITAGDADIISLQEVETEQYYNLFQDVLRPRGYDGYFCAKSRSKHVSERDRMHVDGCAVFYKTEKFTVVQKHMVEFSQIALANSNGSDDMLNRVMTKDNVGVAVLLEVNKEMFTGGLKPVVDRQLILVANTHLHWDPEYSDVKLIQTMMFLSELKTIAERASGVCWPPTNSPPIPIVLCADLNSLPDSGVVEYLSSGAVSEIHTDLKQLTYSKCLSNFSCSGKNGKPNGNITHNFHLKSAYESSLMPYTNYTYFFKGMIDYIFFSQSHLSVLGLLGAPEGLWLSQNIVGCPHPLVPSDHFSLLVQLELHPPPAPAARPIRRHGGLQFLRKGRSLSLQEGQGLENPVGSLLHWHGHLDLRGQDGLYHRDHQDLHQNHATSKPMSPSEAGTQEQGTIKLSLVNSDLWKAFYTSGTEMVITKHGRRMFPHCNISLSGLDPFTNYVIMMDMVPVDQFKYKWNKEEWEVAGKAEPQPPAHTYAHPDSPARGSHWMKQSISFLKAKLTNNTLDQHGHIILHSMHRYSPRFYVVQADSAFTVRWSPYQSFSFPETHFTTVTAYQNTKITKLKIDHNPFAKGFREGGPHFQGKRCRPSKTSKTAEETRQIERDAECKSPSGLQGSMSAIKSEKHHCPNSHYSSSSVDQDPAESLHTDALDLSGQGHGCEEQMVPASMAYQAYRLAEYRPPSPHSDVDNRLRSYEAHVPDVAALPEHHNHPSSRDVSHQHPSAHHHLSAPGQESWPHTASTVATGTAKANAGLRTSYPLYRPRPYPGDHPEADPGRQFMVNSFTHSSPAATFHPTAQHQRAHQPGYHHHHGNTVEWSQYPLFSYSSW